MSIKRRFGRAYKTIGALTGLLAGFAAGLATHASQSEMLSALVPSVAPVGALWINALRMTIIPLVVAGLIVVITAIPGARALGRLSGLSLTIFLVLLAFGGALALVMAPPVIRHLPIDRLNLPAPGAAEAQDSEGRNKATGQRDSVAWIDGLVPPNLIKAAADGQLLPLMVFAVLFGLALTRLDPELQSAVVVLCRGVTAALLVLIRWIFWLAPIGVFALAFVTAARVGPMIAGAVGYYVALQCLLMFAYTLLLYPATAALGRVGIGRFARAIAPAQIVAVSTRSSLAALPAMIEGAAILRLPAVAAGFVLPLSVSVLKISRSITPAVRLFFLSQLYGIPLTPVQVAGFLLTAIALGLTTPGLPDGTAMATLPLYLALGIPLEGVLIFRAADVISDIFATLLNVTGDLTAATLLARFTGTTAVEEGNQISPVAPYPG